MKVEQAGKDTWKFWCPGCNGAHMVSDKWQVDVDTATISPSVLVHSSPVQPRCHSFVTNGQIQFLGDSEHALAGQTVELQDWYEAFAGPQNLM